MGPGDAIIYLADPWLHGAGVIDEILHDGRLLVVFAGDREEVFEPHEIDLLDWWIQGQPTVNETLDRILKETA